ncbi:MAG: hypothetical protein SO182_04845 [Paludibacteraceae bacterium]|nr:hypothetical protein [Paludibacteraceae bacterium]
MREIKKMATKIAIKTATDYKKGYTILYIVQNGWMKTKEQLFSSY